MAYFAVVCKLSIDKHPNADKLAIGKVDTGYQVVVSNNTNSNSIGLFFQADGQLSEEFAKANDLISRVGEDGKRAGGFFDNNRRVRCQTFRGEKSEGFWIPIESLKQFGDISKLKEGDQINTFCDVPICNKYFTPATLKIINSVEKKVIKSNPFFKKHIDTAQFRDNIYNIKKGDLLSVTVKYHGTSARVGFLPTFRKLSFWEKIKNIFNEYKEEYDYFIGTRNCLLRCVADDAIQFITSERYRYKNAQKFKHKLKKNEVIYYELVGYANNGKAIMPRHDISSPTNADEKRIKKEYGDIIDFAYGSEQGTCKEYVYRITNVSPEGEVYDLSNEMMRKRCEELGLNVVQMLIEPFIFDGEYNKLREMIVRKDVLEGIVDGSMKEGAVIRVDNADGVSFQKVKSFSFAYLEGIQKTFESYVDLEEIA